MDTASISPPPTHDWHPAELFEPRQASRTDDSHDVDNKRRAGAPRYAIIILNQPLADNLDRVKHLWDHACIRVAADGGANRLYHVGGQRGDAFFDALDAIVGDLDSLAADARRYYEARRGPDGQPTRILRDPDQESTDFGKAVAYVRAWHREQHKGDGAPLDLVVVGGLGGRVDQALSLIHHLHLFQAGGDDRRDGEGRTAREAGPSGRVYLFSGDSLTFLLRAGRHRIRVRSPADAEDGGGEKSGEKSGDVFGKHVGILPVGEPSRVTTRGLEWDVTDWETRFGGRVSTSNHILPETEVVEVETTKDVVWTMALRGVEGS
ncbi:hypothetical protein VTJ83DRAFT_5201 [Remersonia thermophila]|uniref:Thiamine pyrophosphokinase n=1 Tax=Remersonia thermophila TaxID=72144 RepID=A0ABR4DC49_9PEZI